MNSQDKAVLIYVGDPMCSWCYGFTNELNEVVESLGDDVDFEIVMGGLRPYNDESILELADFLKGHWDEVAHRSGMPFKYEILAIDDFIYDTEPPSRAVVIVRDAFPDKAYLFFKAVQNAFYNGNLRTDDVKTYNDILKNLKIDFVDFEIKFNSKEYKSLIKEDFKRASQLGVSGFPALLLKKGDKTHIVANGYKDSQSIIKTINQLLY
jgi:putative protein-disulfide isomerase